MPNEVAVFDANEPPALAFCRSLGRGQLRCRVFHSSRFSMAGASRFCHARSLAPDPRRVDRFLPWLEDEIQKGNINTIAPTSDLICFYIALVRDRLAPQSARVYPESSDLLGVLFKDRFVSTDDDSIRTPITFAASSVEEAHDIADDLVYPSLIKPRSHVATPSDRGVIVNSPEEFRKHFCRAAVTSSMQSLLSMFPNLDLPIVQQFLSAKTTTLVTVSGFLDPHGAPVVVIGAKKSAQWPPQLGVGLLFENQSVQGIRNDVVDFVRRRISRGIFELELVPDVDGSWIALDLNARAYGQMHFDFARGVDLCGMWARSFAGDDLTEIEECASDVDKSVRFAHGVPLAARAIARAWTSGHSRRALDCFRRETRGAVGIMHDDTDPLPTAFYLRSMLRHPGGLLRPFLAERSDE